MPQPTVPYLPLWRLEMLREQAQRRVARTESEYTQAALELQRIEDAIAKRKEEM
jgi:hypothetical protein